MSKVHKQGEIPVQVWVTWVTNSDAIKILKEDKESINHEEEMGNSLNEDKPGD